MEKNNMTKLSPKNIAEAIYGATNNKSGKELDETLKRSLRILWQKRMLGKSDDILKELQNLFDKKKGVVRMKVTTAVKMGEGERKKIEREIKEKYQAHTVVGEFFEKGDMLGGMRVEIGDEITDTTYKNKLHQLEKFLIQEK